MSYGAVKYLMIFERDGHLVEQPFETSIPFPSTVSGLGHCNLSIPWQLVILPAKSSQRRLSRFRRELLPSSATRCLIIN